jgi:GDPmannose 4,6-dehydratase
MKKKIIVTGCSGMDGSHMVDYLLENTDHDIYGIVRRISSTNYGNLTSALKNPRFKLITGDLSDSQSIDKVVEKIKPDYFINLAAQSFVASSWELPEQTMDINATGVMRCLEAIVRHVPNCRFYNAGSSEQFGDVQYSPQDEKHPHRARSPYGASKIAAYQIVKTYRESFNLYAIQGLLFNHEGPRRGEEFVTRKITKGIARIKYAIDNNLSFNPIELGNLDAKRDWSHSKDFIDGIWRMMNQEKYNKDIDPWNTKSQLYHDFCDKNNIGHTDFGFDNQGQKVEHERLYNERLSRFWSLNIKEYVLSSNETHSIREFIELAFNYAGIEIDNCNPDHTLPVIGHSNAYQINYQISNGQPVVVVNPAFYRPADVEILLGDSTLARKELGWQPKYNFNQLVQEMVKSDIDNYVP